MFEYYHDEILGGKNHKSKNLGGLAPCPPLVPPPMYTVISCLSHHPSITSLGATRRCSPNISCSYTMSMVTSKSVSL